MQGVIFIITIIGLIYLWERLEAAACCDRCDVWLERLEDMEKEGVEMSFEEHWDLNKKVKEDCLSREKEARGKEILDNITIKR